jgi:hypothetical protein
MEHFKGASGQETDAHGIPWNESLTRRELHHLQFEQWRLDKNAEDNSVEEPNPFPPSKVTSVDTKDPAQLEEFLGKRRRRGPRISQGWNDPGI